MYMKVEKLKNILEDILSELEDYNDEDQVVLEPNTYGMTDFIGTSKGYINLLDIKIEEDEDQEE